MPSPLDSELSPLELEMSCIHQLFEHQAQRSPNAVAIEFEQQQITYQELNHRANQLAHYLQSLGVGPETLVGVCMKRSLELFITLFGILKAGGAYLPLDPDYPIDRLAFMLEDAKISVLMTQTSLQASLPLLKTQQILCWELYYPTIAELPSEAVNSSVTAENLAYVIYTSGSTGRPKGVEIRHKSVNNLLHSMMQQMGCTPDDRMLCLNSLCFDMVVPELYLPLVSGARVVLAPQALITQPQELACLLAAKDVTIMQATPTVWQLLVNSGWQGSLRLKMWCGGEPLLPSLANQLLTLGRELWNLYGPTETTVWSAAYRVYPGKSPGCIGAAIANTQLYVLREDAQISGDWQPVPDGSIGELYIGGTGLARGYRHRPDLTTDRFVINPFSSEPKARLYKTGDLARYNANGMLEFLGRSDNQVKIRGFRVELGEIETVLHQHPRIKSAVVTTTEEQSHPQLVAYCVPTTVPSSASVEHWQDLWSAAYTQPNPSDNPHFNISGLNSSYTGDLIPLTELQEWNDNTVRQLRNLCLDNVLEIGCGMGLLCFQLLPHCNHYTGTDISSTAINHIQQHLPPNANATLLKRAAHELNDLPPESFDTIILNSVIQYFPSVEYLMQVIQSAIRLIKPNGRLFIGDVRSLPLLEAFHTSVELHQAPDSLSTLELRQRIQKRLSQEQELLVHPHFFHMLPQSFSQISSIQCNLKQGQSTNELIRFRYDVTLTINSVQLPPLVPTIWDWQTQPISIATLQNLLQTHPFEALYIRGVPNCRLAHDCAAVKLLSDTAPPSTVGALRAVLAQQSVIGIDPGDWWEVSRTTGYSLNINWSNDQHEGSYDVILQHPSLSLRAIDLPNRPQFTAWDQYANTPCSINSHSQLSTQLRQFLRDQLPPHLCPNVYVFLDTLPLTPTGKIDRRALPAPQRHRPGLTVAYSKPLTQLEQQMATLWSQVLNLETVGRHDNFFDLGGHSLLAIQLVEQLSSALRQPVSIVQLLQAPTIAELAQQLAKRAHSETIALDDNHNQDICLDPTIQVGFRPTMDRSPTTPNRIFLTGATGFIGGFLLVDLLQQTDATVYCLVRAKSIEQAHQKITDNLQRYQINLGNRDRIVPVLGDLSQPNLGLSASEFEHLTAAIDQIYHVGAMVNLVYPYSVLRTINVMGSATILKIASRHAIPVHFISTLDVFQSSPYKQQPPYCEVPLNGACDFDTGYAQSKWAAEQLMLGAYQRGIPVTIYRLAQITGHHKTGAAPIDDLLGRFIRGIVNTGVAPELMGGLKMTPVDYVSQTILHLAQTDSAGRIFHLVNPHSPLPFNELIQQFIELGCGIQSLPYTQWRTQASFAGTPLDAIAPLVDSKGQTFLEDALLRYEQFDCQQTSMALHQTSIDCPPTSALLLPYFNFLMKQDMLPASSQGSLVTSSK
jgi:amino acid adenylation domain-containing protein/thioester reductase-like protein